jgi:photosystem II stability/assembly factor-like uncharacterized protein
MRAWPVCFAGMIVVGSLAAAAPKDPPASALPPLNAKVFAYAKANLGRPAGDGVCTTLAIEALEAAGARLYPPAASGDYVWGELVPEVKDALPGDILQFRDAIFKGKRKTGRRTEYWEQKYLHHTAVLARVEENGKAITIYHQNVTTQGKPESDREKVQETVLRLDSLQSGGWVKTYRPLPRVREVAMLPEAVPSPAPAVKEPWELQESGTPARLRGVSAVDPMVAWVSGSQGTCLRTTDGGTTWKRMLIPGSQTLDFRDLHAFDDRTAVLLSIGPGEQSRVFRTSDGGATWSNPYTNHDPKIFLDAIAFWDRDHGLALGDPEAGRHVILSTDDGGATWSRIAAANIPAALPGEGAFAASGTCLVVGEGGRAWFGTGSATEARVFRSTDRGRTWSVATTPVHAGNASSGVFGLAFEGDHGLAVGGDYKKVDDPSGNLALTDDGGKTWVKVDASRPGGFRSAVAFVPGTGGKDVVTVGPAGSDISRDGGRTWTKWSGDGFHALGFGTTAEAGWAVGESGKLGRFTPGAKSTP